jgi:hypothetical protein
MHLFYTMHPANAKKNPIEKQLEGSRTQLLFDRIATKREPTSLETLREQTEPRSIPVHEFQVVAATIQKHKEAARQGILLEQPLHQTDQAIE